MTLVPHHREITFGLTEKKSKVARPWPFQRSIQTTTLSLSFTPVA